MLRKSNGRWSCNQISKPDHALVNAPPEFPYQINVRWSEADKSFEADVPALGTCIAYGETRDEAVREVKIAAKLWLEAVRANGKPIPRPDVT